METNSTAKEGLIVSVGGEQLDLVRRRNEFILANHHLSYQAHRLFLYVLSQVKDHHDENTTYKFSIYELAQKIGIDRSHLYASTVKTLDELASTIVHVPVYDESGKPLPNTFDRVGLIQNKQRIRTDGSGHEMLAGEVSVSLHKELLPYVMRTRSRYTEVELKYVMRLTSSGAQRLYDLLKVRAFTGKPWKVKKEELRALLGFEASKFENWGDFRRFVLERAQAQISTHTDLAFDLDYGTKGRAVTDVIFRFRKEGGENVASLPGTKSHAVLKEMMQIGIAAKEAEKLIEIFWDNDRERLEWHLGEAKRRAAAGQVKSTAGWFRSGVRHDYRPQKPLFAALQKEALDKRETYEAEKKAQMDGELQQALKSLKDHFDVDKGSGA